jgi:hypothetical protein
VSKFLTRVFPALLILTSMLLAAHAAFAQVSTSAAALSRPRPFAAPEIDPRLAIEGLAVAAGCAVLLWERIRRHR